MNRILREEIDIALAKYSYPKGIKLPKGSDVPQIEKLFTKKQLAQLAFKKFDNQSER